MMSFRIAKGASGGPPSWVLPAPTVQEDVVSPPQSAVHSAKGEHSWWLSRESNERWPPIKASLAPRLPTLSLLPSLVRRKSLPRGSHSADEGERVVIGSSKR
jgi:hypothetical protein